MNNRSMNYAEKFSKLIKYETISYYGENDLDKFRGFHDVLKESFPNVFEKCEFEDYEGSILLKWKGTSDTKEPILFMNHFDVVEATGDWKHDPFGGKIAEGKIWGRGTLDTKGGLFCMLQAAEEMIESGHVPERDIYFESACNEETDGYGADTITKVLKEKDIHFFMVLDEGGMIVHDPIGGADGDFAMIGVGEKGCADLKFIAKSNGGHASTPGKNTPLVKLGKFMTDVDKSKIFISELSPTIEEMLRRIAPTTNGIFRVVCIHPRLFKTFLTKVVASISPKAGAMFKTTMAFTTCHGSEGLNVLPKEAYVTGNMRYSHHQGRDASIESVRTIAKKHDIEMEIIDPGFESGISDYRSEAFKLFEKSVSEVFPDVITCPYIMTGASDSRYFTRICDNCFRFVPFKISDEQLGSIHGRDENIEIDSLPPAVDFYKNVIKTTGGEN